LRFALHVAALHERKYRERDRDDGKDTCDDGTVHFSPHFSGAC
jgi:hypothetical protein